MRKIFVFALSVLIFFIFGSLSPKVYAAISFTPSPNPVCQDKGSYTLTFKGPLNTFSLTEDYSLGLWRPNTNPNNLDQIDHIEGNKPLDTQAYTSKNILLSGEGAIIGQWHYKLWLGKGFGVLKQEPKRLLASGDFTIYPRGACDLGLPILEMPSPLQINATAPVKVRNIDPNSDYILWFLNGKVFNDGKFPSSSIISETITDSAGNAKDIKTAYFNVRLDNQPGNKTLCLRHGSTTLGFGKDNCEISIPIEVTVQAVQITPTIVQSGQPGAPLEDSALFKPPPPPPCAEPLTSDGRCLAVNTAIGKINTEPQAFVRSIFNLVLGLAGGIALLLIIISGYRFMTSGGNPEKTKAATEQLTSAIIGLLFIIFSFVILQIVGVDILRIPGFTP